MQAELGYGIAGAGRPTGPMDMFLAAQATSRDMVLITNNEREFRRLAGLGVESWAPEGRPFCGTDEAE